MTDIVQDLREHHAAIGFDDHTETWLTAAADEIERLREELYEIKLAAAGGEDVPGAANMVTANDVEKWVTKYCEEIERLPEALRDCHHVLHKLMAIVPGNDTAVDEMAKVMTKARAALGEGKE